MNASKIRIFYPADPMGVVPGGIDTFLRGMFKWAPEDLEFSLVGMTTDPIARPVGEWTRCVVGQRAFDFFPVVSVADAGTRGRAPLSLRFVAGSWRHRAMLRDDFDVFDFHRIEPALLFAGDARSKNAYFHNDPATVRMTASDNLWRRSPAAYERIEARVMRQLSSAWCVRESGVETLRSRYPAVASRINFVSTWVDTSVFYPLPPAERNGMRQALGSDLRISPQSHWIVFVGRLDTQKNPALLVAAFARLRAEQRDVVLLFVGDGVLRQKLEEDAQAAGVRDRIRFLGLRPAQAIADLLRAADLFALPSAYEGMPMAVLEALGCGTPVVVTDVGEVRRVVRPGVNGVIVSNHDEVAFAAALTEGLAAPSRWRAASVAAVQAYQPTQVLAPIYDNYRDLARGHRSVRLGAEVQRQQPAVGRHRAPVVGAPIDVLDSNAFTAQVMAWAKARESRTVCFCNVHSAVLAGQDPSHRLALESADLVAPDGAPIAWSLRRKGFKSQDRVDGPGTMWKLCRMARDQGVKLGLFGSTPATLQALEDRLRISFPGLKVAYVHSPPFREATDAEDDAICKAIERAEVGLLFVGLGCPKQERWIAQHRGRIPAVMLGLGAAFDFHAGTVKRAPAWMRDSGFEWLHRLGSEPRRLGWRYLSSNSIFIAKTVREARSAVFKRTPRPKTRATSENSRQWAVTTVMPMTAMLRGDGDAQVSRPRIERRQIEALSARIDAMLPQTGGRLVAFIASGSGEGTSTVARAYALANAAPLGRQVLLVSASQEADERPGLLDALRTGQPLDQVVARRSRGVFVASLGPIGNSDHAWSLLARPDLLDALRERFELVALDMPALNTSSAGLRLAPLCDGVVVVLEAEKTRAPVVAHLIESLHGVRARVLGTVLNKRQFHVPERVYRWL